VRGRDRGDDPLRGRWRTRSTRRHETSTVLTEPSEKTVVVVGRWLRDEPARGGAYLYHDLAASRRRGARGSASPGVGISAGACWCGGGAHRDAPSSIHLATRWHGLASRQRPRGSGWRRRGGWRRARDRRGLKLHNPLSAAARCRLRRGSPAGRTTHRSSTRPLTGSWPTAIPPGVRFEVNGRLVRGASRGSRPVRVAVCPTAAKRSGRAWLPSACLAAPEDQQGLAVSTLGRSSGGGGTGSVSSFVVRPGLVGGAIEAPAVGGAHAQQGRLRPCGRPWITYLGYRRGDPGALQGQLTAGVRPRTGRTPSGGKAARPLRRDLQMVPARPRGGIPAALGLVEPSLGWARGACRPATRRRRTPRRWQRPPGAPERSAQATANGAAGR